MKIEDVPQDKSSLSEKNINEICYAVDENGNYTTQLSSGWNVKAEALTQSLEHFEERIAIYKEKYKKGECSPIPYFMELNRMDITTLSDYMNQFSWITKWHFKPFIFKKLSFKKIKLYAETFNITIEELKGEGL